MVPGSTFRYGSHFWMVILKPRLSRRQPIEDAATPLPREETTPGYKNIFWRHPGRSPPHGAELSLSNLHRIDVHIIIFGSGSCVNEKSLLGKIGKSHRSATFLRSPGS